MLHGAMATVEQRPSTLGDEESGGHSPGMKLLFGNQYRLRQQRTTVMRAVILLAVALALIVVVTLPVTKDHPKLTTNSVAPLISRRRAFSLTSIFKVKRPEISTNSVKLSHVQFDILSGAPKLNMTLTVDVSVKNPNPASLDYDDILTTLSYANTTVAKATVPSGSCPADGTTRMIVSVNVMADRLLSAPNFVPQVLRGSIPMSSVTVISGRIKVLRLIPVRLRARLTCDFDVLVKEGSVQNVSCRTSVEM